MRLAVDIGGTFTDAVAALDDGSLLVAKIRSTPKTPEDGFLSAISLLVSENKLPPSEVSEIVHVGTIGTNLFLGQAGLQLPKVALIATKGFSDIIEIGRQNRPELYNIFFQRPTPLVQRRLRFEVTERVDSSGRTLQVPSPSDLEDLSRLLKDESVQGVAISFLNSYLNPANELEAKRILQQRLQVPVFASSEVDPEHREYERTSTTVINALLAPTVSAYLRSAMDKLRVAGFTCDMEILSSAGGLVDVEEAKSRPILTIESGPAAGVVGAAELAKLLHIDRMISLDMGGTSAKAGCVVNSLPLVVPEIEVGGKVHMGRAVKGSGYPLRSPCVDLAEVSAGGGTIIWSDETGTLKVGPVSAGAEPGPACYDTGGRNATITDANLVLGRIQEKLLGGKLLLNGRAAEKALWEVAQGTGLDLYEVAASSLKLVNLHMAKAVQIVSLERGYDPRDFSLLSFGGAGPMHAAEVANEMRIDEIIVPPWPGLFSALGMLLADSRYNYVRGMLDSLANLAEDKIEQQFNSMTREAFQGLDNRKLDRSKALILRALDLRYAGQGYELEIAAPVPFNYVDTVSRFEAEHEAVYGYKHGGGGVEVTALRLTIVLPGRKTKIGTTREGNVKAEDALISHRQIWFTGDWLDAPVYSREHLPPNNTISGPAIVEEYDSTIVIPPDWKCENDTTGCLILRRFGN